MDSQIILLKKDLMKYTLRDIEKMANTCNISIDLPSDELLSKIAESNCNSYKLENNLSISDGSNRTFNISSSSNTLRESPTLFGDSSGSENPDTPLFATPSKQPSLLDTPLFGTKSKQPSLLDTPSKQQSLLDTPNTPLFGTPSKQQSLLDTPNTPLFGAKSKQQSLLDTPNTPLFGAKSTQQSLLGTKSTQQSFELSLAPGYDTAKLGPVIRRGKFNVQAILDTPVDGSLKGRFFITEIKKK